MIGLVEGVSDGDSISSLWLGLSPVLSSLIYPCHPVGEPPFPTNNAAVYFLAAAALVVCV